jgi:hypothetical protein
VTKLAAQRVAEGVRALRDANVVVRWRRTNAYLHVKLKYRPVERPVECLVL